MHRVTISVRASAVRRRCPTIVFARPKSSTFTTAARRHLDVGRLQIAVNDDLSREPPSSAPAIWTARRRALGNRTAWLRVRDADRPSVSPSINSSTSAVTGATGVGEDMGLQAEDRADVRMIQRGERARFASKPGSSRSSFAGSCDADQAVSILSATSRWSAESWARNTSPIPPSPSFPTMR